MLPPHDHSVDEGHVGPAQGGDQVVQLVLLPKKFRRLNPLDTKGHTQKDWSVCRKGNVSISSASSVTVSFQSDSLVTVCMHAFRAPLSLSKACSESLCGAEPSTHPVHRMPYNVHWLRLFS